MRSLYGVSLAVIAVLLLPGALRAQDDPDDRPSHRGTRGSNPSLREVSSSERHSFWAEFGVGVGSESYQVPSATVGYSNTLQKPTVNLALGGTVNPNLRLGVGFFGWFNEERGTLESVTALMGVARFYPARNAGLYLDGGVGVGRYGLDFDSYTHQADLGWAGQVGAGYEFRVSRDVFVAPTVQVLLASFSGRSFATYRERVVNVGLSVVFQGN